MVVDLLLSVAATMGFCVCSMFCCTLFRVPFCFAIILFGSDSLLLVFLSGVFQLLCGYFSQCCG